MKFIYKYLVGINLFLGCFLAASSCFALTPSETMKKSVDAILDVLDRGDTSDNSVWQKQREEVSSIVASQFDLREMAKRSLAKYWKKRTPAEQDDFAELFAELIKNTYIERLRSFSGSKDGTKFEREIIRGKKSVVSSVVWQNGKEISVVYKLYHKDNAWFVYDVIIENVSLVRNYRSQFAQVIQKDGYEALVRKIKEKLMNPPIIGEHARLGE
jgi:phospholipid transport system substrate-binding protein